MESTQEKKVVEAETLEIQTSNDYHSICPECDSNQLIPDKVHGEKVCSKCGYVVQEIMVDHTREWRAFNLAEVNKRSRQRNIIHQS